MKKTGFVKAMGNTYGILLITVLMGNGLVSLPRRMWYYADIDAELNGLYMMVRYISHCSIIDHVPAIDHVPFLDGQSLRNGLHRNDLL